MVFLLSCGVAQSQETTNSSRTVEYQIPFRMSGEYLVTVEGQIGSLYGLRFVIDTGATYSVVNRKIAQSLHLVHASGRIFKFDHYATVDWAVFPNLQVGPIAVSNAKLIVDQIRDPAREVDAIIGLDLLAKSKRLRIDYENQTVSFGERSARDAPNLTCLTAQIILQDRALNLVADTALRGFILYEDNARHYPRSVLKLDKKARVGETHARQARISAGSSDVGAPEVTVYLITRPSSGVPAGVDGYFGMDTLKAHAVEFDFENRRLRWD
jgi:predicted aspartyl protease